MKKSDRFKPIHRVVANREQAAAQALAQSQQRLQDSLSRQEMLTTYRQDYLQLFHQAAQQSMSGSQLASYQAFINQLDSAIGQEGQQREQIQRECEARKRHWLLRHQKTQVMEKAIDRFRVTEQKQEDRREQRQTDDQALRPKRED